MIFLHLADLHLGKSLGGFSFLEDQRYILNQALSVALDSGAKAILVSGDVYDRSVPPEEAVGLLDEFISRVTAAGLTLLMISGNHDSDERLHFGRDFFARGGAHIAGKYEGGVPCVTLEDEYGPVRFHLLPFVKRFVVAHYHPEEECGTCEEAIAAALRHARVNLAERNVLLAHQFVAGRTPPATAGSEALPDNLGLVERVSWEVFDAFDYVALGHIHAAQPVGRATCRYAGSPLKYSAREALQRKSVTLVTLGPKGQAEAEVIPLRPLRDLRVLTGPLEELLRSGGEEGADDYIQLRLTDQAVIPGAAEMARQRFPRLIGLEWAGDSPAGESAAQPEKGYASFEDLAEAFFSHVTGQPPTDAEWRVLEEAAKEAKLLP